METRVVIPTHLYHTTGKSGKVMELERGQGKVRGLISHDLGCGEMSFIRASSLAHEFGYHTSDAYVNISVAGDVLVFMSAMLRSP